ncbi:MAG: hypothetical protein ACI865_000334 [Flavobacteriaceae bacterium]|jgi:hypothetical protein
MKFSASKLILLCLLILTASSCRKKEDTIVEIYVRTSANVVVPNATVRLYTNPPYEPNSNAALEMEGQTDINGVIRYNFNDVYQLGQAGVAVLEIEVTKEGSTSNGIIKIEQETTSKKTIYL